jgi:uncharacterized Zn-finger protein
LIHDIRTGVLKSDGLPLTVVNKPFQCNECEATFFKQFQLNEHIKKTHKEQEVFRCSFEGCGKEFNKECNLTYHEEAIHLNIKRFNCDYHGCTFETYYKSKIEAHSRLHANIGEFYDHDSTIIQSNLSSPSNPTVSHNQQNKSRFDQKAIDKILACFEEEEEDIEEKKAEVQTPPQEHLSSRIVSLGGSPNK